MYSTNFFIRLMGFVEAIAELLFRSFDKNCFVFVAVCFESLSHCNVHFSSRPIFKIDSFKFSFEISMYLSALTMPSIDKYHEKQAHAITDPWQSVKHTASLRIHFLHTYILFFLNLVIRILSKLFVSRTIVTYLYTCWRNSNISSFVP